MPVTLVSHYQQQAAAVVTVPAAILAPAQAKVKQVPRRRQIQGRNEI